VLVPSEPGALGTLEEAGWKALAFHFQAAEFESPCVRLLEALYGKENVEHTGGKNENGADAICSYQDPLGISCRVAVQIKMWTGDSGWTRPLEQIERAYESYEGITAGVVLTTSEKVTPEFEAARQELERRLRIPVRVVLRRELLRLFLAHLPGLVGNDDADTPMRPGHPLDTENEDGPRTHSRRRTFADLFPRSVVSGPTASNEVTNLAWELGKSCGLKLSGTYQLPRTTEGSHRVVFVVKGSVAPQQQAALLDALKEHAGDMAVGLGPHPGIEVDLEGEPASALQALVGTFSV
jgi:Restriction endonuclease